MIKTSYHMPASLAHMRQSGQILTCSQASPSGFNIMALFNLVQMLRSNKPYSLSPIYTSNLLLVSASHINFRLPEALQSWSWCFRDAQMWRWWWYKTGRFRNFQEPRNTYFSWQIMNKVSFTNSFWAANILLSLHCSEKNPQVLPLHCAWVSLFWNRSTPPHTSPCRQKTVSTTHLQKLGAQEGAMLTYNYMRKKGKIMAKTQLQFLSYPEEREFSPHPTCDAICILYIHTHIFYWLLDGHDISSAHLC